MYFQGKFAYKSLTSQRYLSLNSDGQIVFGPETSPGANEIFTLYSDQLDPFFYLFQAANLKFLSSAACTSYTPAVAQPVSAKASAENADELTIFDQEKGISLQRSGPHCFYNIIHNQLQMEHLPTRNLPASALFEIELITSAPPDTVNVFNNSDLAAVDLSGWAGVWPPHFDTTVYFNKAQMKKANLAGLDLTGSRFVATDLTEVGFKGTNLTGAVFDGAKFHGSDLTRATISQDASFRGADLTGCNLEGLDLSAADLTGANLSGVDLSGVVLSGRTKLAGAKLNGANLDGLDLTGIDLTGTDFTSTYLLQTTFDKTTRRFSSDPKRPTIFAKSTLSFDILGLDWSCLDLTDAKIQDRPDSLEGLVANSAILNNIALQKMNLMRADFDNAHLRNANLSFANLSNTTFRGASLNGNAEILAAKLTGANMSGADLTGANLSGANLELVYLYSGAKLTGATLVDASFTNAFLGGMDLSAAQDKKLQGVGFSGACLVNCILEGTDLTDFQGKPTSMVGSCLQGASFKDATLFGAVLSDAAIALEVGSLQVTLDIDGKSYPLQYHFQPTVLPESATDQTTTCPNSDDGPCIGTKLDSPNAPTKWPSDKQRSWRQQAFAQTISSASKRSP